MPIGHANAPRQRVMASRCVTLPKGFPPRTAAIRRIGKQDNYFSDAMAVRFASSLQRKIETFRRKDFFLRNENKKLVMSQ